MLTPGTRLGPYEIQSLIGAGGMGQVYRARDTRLNRTVAVKVSHERFTDRFEAEARSIAALNHPNICQLYDVGPNFLVMELVAGAPIAPRLGVDRRRDVHADDTGSPWRNLKIESRAFAFRNAAQRNLAASRALSETTRSLAGTCQVKRQKVTPGPRPLT